MAAAVSGDAVRLGLLGGAVRSDDDPATRRDAVAHLVAAGARRAAAEAFVGALPVWTQERAHAAAQSLHRTFYQVTGWKPALLELNREKAQQQRQIAEEIQRRKLAQDYGNPVDEERRLLSLIRAGDRKGARRVLNQLLGSMFLASPGPAVVRARAIEMLGYLVRAAVENSPDLEPLIVRNHRWTARLIECTDFEDLAEVLRQALDDFMENVYLLGYAPTHAAVRRALSYLADHFTGPITLADAAKAAGLSPFRLAHLMKQSTGRTMLQHVTRLRVQLAQRLLAETARPAADIALEAGFGEQSYFIRQFRRHTGLTPGRYRRLHGPPAVVCRPSGESR
jgi:two-component system response regulator YesN